MTTATAKPRFKTGQRVKVIGPHCDKNGRVSDYDGKKQFIGQTGAIVKFFGCRWPRGHDSYLLSLTKDYLFAPDQLEAVE